MGGGTSPSRTHARRGSIPFFCPPLKKSSYGHGKYWLFLHTLMVISRVYTLILYMVTWIIEHNYPMRVGGHGYSSLLVCLFVTRGARGRPRVQQYVGLFVCLLPEARVGGHGYSSLLLPEARGRPRVQQSVGLFVCLSVCLSQVYLLTLVPQHCLYSMDSLHTTISCFKQWQILMLKLLCRAKAKKLEQACDQVCLPGCSSTAFTA